MQDIGIVSSRAPTVDRPAGCSPHLLQCLDVGVVRRGWVLGGGPGMEPSPRRRRAGPSPGARGSRPRARTAQSAAATPAPAPGPRASRASPRRSREPRTPSTGWVIRRASSRVKRHSCKDGSSTPKKVSASATICVVRTRDQPVEPGSVVWPDRPPQEAVDRSRPCLPADNAASPARATSPAALRSARRAAPARAG